MDSCDHNLPFVNCTHINTTTVSDENLTACDAPAKESTKMFHTSFPGNNYDTNSQPCSTSLSQDIPCVPKHHRPTSEYFEKTLPTHFTKDNSSLDIDDANPTSFTASVLSNDENKDALWVDKLTENIVGSQNSNRFCDTEVANNIERSQSVSSSDLDILETFEAKANFTIALTNTEDDENTTQLRFSFSNNNTDYFKENNSTLLTPVTNANNLPNQSFINSENNHSTEISYLLTSQSSDTCDEDSFLLSSSSLDESADTDDSITEDTVFSDSLTSPLLEESSLDSGIASLDDHEPSATAPNNDSSSSSSNMLKDDNGENKSLATDNTDIQTDAFARVPAKKRSHVADSCIAGNQIKRVKKEGSRKVNFNGVTIYYFPRKQSFVTVPSQGGSTLGMSLQHSHFKNFSLDEHKRVIACHRRRVIKQHKRQQRIDAKLKELKQDYPNLDASQLMPMIVDADLPDPSSASSSDECDEDTLENDFSDDEDFYFLQPIPTKKRRFLLRMAGVQRIDAEEKLSNKFTRESREICGCDCDGICSPSRCECALSGIPCQVDRESFPCGCVASGCHNPTGRVEFDAERVRNHHLQTMRRLRLEETGSLPSLGTEYVSPSVQRSPYVSADTDHDVAKENTSGEEAHSQTLPETDFLFSNSCDLNGIIPTISTDPNLPFSTTWSLSANSSQISATGLSNTVFASNEVDSCYIAEQSSNVFQNCQISPITTTSPYNDFSFPKQSDLNYFSPQPASTSAILPISTMPYSEKSSSNFSFATNSQAQNADSNVGYSAINPHGCKPSFKLDPIASLLPLNAAASRRVCQDSSFQLTSEGTFESLQQVEATSCSSQQTSISECSYDSSVQA